MQVIVVGGGVIGALSAYYLDRAGAEVTLLEKRPALAAAASGMNAHQLSYSFISPLGGPALPGLALRGLLGGLEDVKVEKPGAAFWSWGLRLLLESLPARAVANRAALLTLSLESRALMADFRRAHAIDFGWRENGKLHLYASARQMEEARAFAEILAPLGLRQEMLTPEECVARVPALEKRKGVLAGGMFSHADAAGDCGAFTRALEGLFSPRVRLRKGTAVSRIFVENGACTGVGTEGGERLMADAVLVCAGAEAGVLLRTAGMRVALYPVKGYTASFPRGDMEIPCNVTDHARRVVLLTEGDRLRVSGLLHFSGLDAGIAPATIAHFTRIARETVGLEPREAEISAGFRPYMPDSVPVVGATRVPGLHVNIGHGMLGWTLAHATCKRAAAGVCAAGRKEFGTTNGHE